MKNPKLFVAFACDTEDNHPNYVPGWEKYGSNYDLNPAVLKWEWTQFWSDLSECFVKKNAPVTWLIRVDDGPVYDAMLNLFGSKILELRSIGDEIGIHIHTWSWSEKFVKWVQTTKPEDEIRIVNNSLKLFKKHLGFAPLSARMGWNAMSNAIMRTLNSNGVIAEASATPRLLSKGKFNNRDNIFDWSRTPATPYHPSISDYQSSGNMGILETPIASITSNKSSTFGKMVNSLSGKKALFNLVRVAKLLQLTPHQSFSITPWWSSSVYKKIIREYSKKAHEQGFSFLIGTFHPCDILDLKTGSKNIVFETCISNILKDLSYVEDLDVIFVTLSDMVKEIESTFVKSFSY